MMIFEIIVFRNVISRSYLSPTGPRFVSRMNQEQDKDGSTIWKLMINLIHFRRSQSRRKKKNGPDAVDVWRNLWLKILNVTVFKPTK